MLEVYQNPPTTSHQNDALHALCQTKVPALIDRGHAGGHREAEPACAGAQRLGEDGEGVYFGAEGGHRARGEPSDGTREATEEGDGVWIVGSRGFEGVDGRVRSRRLDFAGGLFGGGVSGCDVIG